MSIRLYGDPVLTTPATPVEEFDSSLTDIAELIDRELNLAAGMAVAANQVGSPIALFGYKDFADPVKHNFMVNPTLRFEDPSKKWMYKEGCLSLPGMFWYIQRPRYVTVYAQSLTGDKVTILASDLKGRMFQHEMDHLKGRLILDRITARERKIAVRTLASTRVG